MQLLLPSYKRLPPNLTACHSLEAIINVDDLEVLYLDAREKAVTPDFVLQLTRSNNVADCRLELGN